MAADLAMECIIQDYIHPDDETLQSAIEMTPFLQGTNQTAPFSILQTNQGGYINAY